MPTSDLGMAWIADASYAIWLDSPNTGITRRPTRSAIMYVVATQQELRYQIIQISATDSVYGGVIRTVQGHSGPIHSRIDRSRAFCPLGEPAFLVHYTQARFANEILSSGIMPGGPQGNRGEIHIATAPPNADGTLPIKFNRRGTDCAVYLNVPNTVFQMRTTMVRSALDVILVNEPIGPDLIQRIVLLKEPRYTLYSAPKQSQLDAAESTACTCIHCGKSYRLGTWWCIYG